MSSGMINGAQLDEQEAGLDKQIRDLEEALLQSTIDKRNHELALEMLNARAASDIEYRKTHPNQQFN